MSFYSNVKETHAFSFSIACLYRVSASEYVTKKNKKRCFNFGEYVINMLEMCKMTTISSA